MTGGFKTVVERARSALSEAPKKGLRVEVTLESPASEGELGRLRAAVDQRCPVLVLLENATPVAIEAQRARSWRRAESNAGGPAGPPRSFRPAPTFV